MEGKNYEIGWKKAHIDQLISFITDEEVSARYRTISVTILGEYLLIYSYKHHELSVHFQDEGLWVFTLNIFTGEYESAYAREMNRALLKIFNEIGLREELDE